MGFSQNVGGNPLDKLVDAIGAVTQGKRAAKQKIQDIKDAPRNLADRAKQAVVGKVVPSGNALCNKLGHKVKKGRCPRCNSKIL